MHGSGSGRMIRHGRVVVDHGRGHGRLYGRVLLWWLLLLLVVSVGGVDGWRGRRGRYRLHGHGRVRVAVLARVDGLLCEHGRRCRR